MALQLPAPPCFKEPHVHIEGHGIRHQVRVGDDFDGYNGYRQRLQVTWHGIDEFPIEEYFAYSFEGPVIEARLARYVG